MRNSFSSILMAIPTHSPLVELYKDRIYRSIYSIVQDKHAAEEIFREVFIRIINNLMAGKTAEDGISCSGPRKLRTDFAWSTPAKPAGNCIGTCSRKGTR